MYYLGLLSQDKWPHTPPLLNPETWGSFLLSLPLPSDLHVPPAESWRTKKPAAGVSGDSRAMWEGTPAGAKVLRQESAWPGQEETGQQG
jgi:hypothetical protein